MKHRIAVLLLSVLAMTSASESIVSSRPGPQPRLRLKQSTQGVSSQIEPVKVPSSQQTPVSMEKVVVTDSKLPSAPKAEANDPVHFSPLRGGPIFKGKIGELPISVGLWPWREILTDDIPFQHQKTRADFDVVRIKL